MAKATTEQMNELARQVIEANMRRDRDAAIAANEALERLLSPNKSEG